MWGEGTAWPDGLNSYDVSPIVLIPLRRFGGFSDLHERAPLSIGVNLYSQPLRGSHPPAPNPSWKRGVQVCRWTPLSRSKSPQRRPHVQPMWLALPHEAVAEVSKDKEPKGKERKGKERNGTERNGKDRTGQERKRKERKGKERNGTERKGQERTGKERTGKEKKDERKFKENKTDARKVQGRRENEANLDGRWQGNERNTTGKAEGTWKDSKGKWKMKGKRKCGKGTNMKGN